MVRDIPINTVQARFFTIPADAPEAEAGGRTGFGCTRGAGSVAALIAGRLAEVPHERDAITVPTAWQAMRGAIRGMGRSGIAATAIPAMDRALSDLKGQSLDLPLATLIERVRDAVPANGGIGIALKHQDAERLAG